MFRLAGRVFFQFRVTNICLGPERLRATLRLGFLFARSVFGRKSSLRVLLKTRRRPLTQKVASRCSAVAVRDLAHMARSRLSGLDWA